MKQTWVLGETEPRAGKISRNSIDSILYTVYYRITGGVRGTGKVETEQKSKNVKGCW